MSTLPRDGFSGRGRGPRRKPLIIGGIVVAFLVAWSYFALSYGGEEQARSATPKSGGATTQTTDSAVPDEPAYAEGNSSNASTNGSAGDSAGGSTNGSAAGAGNSADQSSEAEGGGSDAGGSAKQEPSPAGGQEESAHDHSAGATNEPGNYDPLGRDAEQGDLAPIDEERLRFAAANYISAAYGYSGNDKNAYNQGVGNTVVWPDFFDSEGSSETERYAKQVEDSGTKSGAVLTEFEPIEITEDRATAYAYFETGSGYTKNGGLSGETQAYRQKMILVRTGATWKVWAVEKIEEAA